MRIRHVLLSTVGVVSLVSGLLMIQSAAAAASTVYYVSPTGDDAAGGSSAALAWRTLDRVNRQTLRSGDAVLLEGGGVFAGTLRLTSGDGGSPLNPVHIGSYGSGRATIRPVADSAITVYDTAGIEISDLVISGNSTTLSVSGINAYNDLAGNQKLPYLRIERVDVSGFLAGIAIGGGVGSSGFRDVTVADSDVHDNAAAGLTSYGPAFDAGHPSYAHERITVSDVHAYRNRGDVSNTSTNSGNGIVLGSVQGATIEQSRANNNGDLCTAPEGPVGIWTYDSDSVTIQRNISDHNRTGKVDGEGFDLDQNVSNSTLQNNLSFGNDGAGFLVYTARNNTAHHDNVVRYNMSVGNSVRLGWLAEITVWGPVTKVTVEHNTVIARPTGGQLPPALRLQAGITGVSVRSNVLISDGAGPAVQAEGIARGAVSLQNNDYYVSTGVVVVGWNSTNYQRLSSWSVATGQERRKGVLTGTSVNPMLADWRAQLVAIDTDRLPTDIGALGAFKLTPTSPLRTASPAAGGVGVVTDIFGTRENTSAAGATGAHQPYPKVGMR